MDEFVLVDSERGQQLLWRQGEMDLVMMILTAMPMSWN
jgi:hypothetical protein